MSGKRKPLYISLPEAHDYLSKRLPWYNELNWSSIGITRTDYYHTMLLSLEIKLYGYPTLDGEVYGRARLKHVKVYNFQDNTIQYEFIDNYNAIAGYNPKSKITQVYYTGLCVKKTDLQKYCEERDHVNEQMSVPKEYKIK